MIHSPRLKGEATMKAKRKSVPAMALIHVRVTPEERRRIDAARTGAKGKITLESFVHAATMERVITIENLSTLLHL